MGNHSMERERTGEAKRRKGVLEGREKKEKEIVGEREKREKGEKEVVEGREKREREERKIEGRESEKNGIDKVTYKEERILKH